jgi:long-chain acyl-CoA synthetase
MDKAGLHEYIDHMARWENRTYLVGYRGYRKVPWTFKEIRNRIYGLSRWLKEKNIKKGDKIILFGKSSPEWVIAFFAILHRGCIVVPLDSGTPERLFSNIYQKTSPALVICDTPPSDESITHISFSSIKDFDSQEKVESVPISPDDTAEIVFTSGTTSDPKGVVLTHRNVLSNLKPLDEGIEKHQKIVRFLTPFRILCTVPYSHMFGQVTGLFLPILIGSTIYFTHETGPASLIRAIHRDRILTLIAVPRVLKLLTDHVKAELDAKGKLGGFERRWDKWVKLPYPIRVFFYFDVHLMLGIHFWSFIVGGAPLDPDTHEFWRRLVFSVFQGYGLTETAPIVTMFNPFRHKRDSVGKLFPGQEIKIGPDGEILIKGANVMAGYWSDPEGTSTVLKNGWLRTGDIGSIDEEGHVYIKGRKKEMIVTSDGHNVYPEDIENVLNRMEGVREAVVLGLEEGGTERIHAVLLLDTGADPDYIIENTNSQLLPWQRIRGYTVWDEADFPRTPTLKVRKIEIINKLKSPEKVRSKEMDFAEELISGSPEMDTKLVADLGMSSLDLVETITSIEKKYNISIDESAIGPETTVKEIKKLATHPQTVRTLHMPRWSRWTIIRFFRCIIRGLIVFPFFRFYCRLRTHGLENIRHAEEPGIFAVNHTSDLDPLAVLLALPACIRPRVAPAMGLNMFHPYFERFGHVSREERRAVKKVPKRQEKPVRRSLYGFAYYLITFLFQTFPFPQATAYRSSFEYIGELLDRGFWILIFPEGIVSPTGEFQHFHGGIAAIAEKTAAPIYPVGIKGMREVLPPGKRWPKRRRVDVCFGKPLMYNKSTAPSFTEEIENAVHNLISPPQKSSKEQGSKEHCSQEQG